MANARLSKRLISRTQPPWRDASLASFSLHHSTYCAWEHACSLLRQLELLYRLHAWRCRTASLRPHYRSQTAIMTASGRRDMSHRRPLRRRRQDFLHNTHGASQSLGFRRPMRDYRVQGREAAQVRSERYGNLQRRASSRDIIIAGIRHARARHAIASSVSVVVLVVLQCAIAVLVAMAALRSATGMRSRAEVTVLASVALITLMSIAAIKHYCRRVFWKSVRSSLRSRRCPVCNFQLPSTIGRLVCSDCGRVWRLPKPQ